MSGFEVVGVVLAVIPLLVEGLKAYQHGLETASHMVKYEKTIQSLVLAFSVDSSRYVHTYPDEWSELLDHPGGKSWKDQELGRQIQERLGMDYSMFIQVAQRLHHRLMKFALKLELDQATLKPRWIAAPLATQPSLKEKFFTRSNQTWKGLKMGFKNGSLETALFQIEADLDRLDKLLDANEREAPLRQERRRRGNAKVWQNIREAAKNMYSALAAHWQCSPTHKHAASLRLELREASDQQATFRFGLVISLDDTACQPQQLLWRELEVEPTQVVPLPQTVVSTAQPARSVTGSFRVSFMINTPTVVVTHTQTVSSGANVQPSMKIKDFCTWQQKPPPLQDIRLGFFEHQTWHYHMYQAKERRTLPANLRLLSLRECVAGNASSTPTSPIISGGLRTKEKYHIASVLASSVLQLADTPWLPESTWDLEQIFLMQLQQRDLTTASPSLRREFSPAPTLSPSKPAVPLIDNQLVFAFGVILIELAFQKPLLNFKQPEDLDQQGNTHAYTELQIATRLVKDLNSMEGEKYADAARRCVKCNFDVSECNLENADFQEQFYKGVVQPLEDLRRALD